jgi:hypothetical protein
MPTNNKKSANEVAKIGAMQAAAKGTFDNVALYGASGLTANAKMVSVTGNFIGGVFAVDLTAHAALTGNNRFQLIGCYATNTADANKTSINQLATTVTFNVQLVSLGVNVSGGSPLPFTLFFLSYKV